MKKLLLSGFVVAVLAAASCSKGDHPGTEQPDISAGENATEVRGMISDLLSDCGVEFPAGETKTKVVSWGWSVAPDYVGPQSREQILWGTIKAGGTAFFFEIFNSRYDNAESPRIREAVNRAAYTTLLAVNEKGNYLNLRRNLGHPITGPYTYDGTVNEAGKAAHRVWCDMIPFTMQGMNHILNMKENELFVEATSYANTLLRSYALVWPEASLNREYIEPAKIIARTLIMKDTGTAFAEFKARHPQVDEYLDYLQMFFFGLENIALSGGDVESYITRFNLIARELPWSRARAAMLGAINIGYYSYQAWR